MTFCISFTDIRNHIMIQKTAIIVWVGWQDGSIMREFLKGKNYTIIWVSRNKNIYHWITLWEESTNILDKEQVNNLIKTYKPDEIYYFAAYHHSSQDIVPKDDILFKESTDIHVNWYITSCSEVFSYK